MRQLTDNQLNDRINRIHKRLRTSAIRHANLLDHLRPEIPQRWTYAEMGEPGGDAIEVKARVRFMGRSLPLPFYE